MKIAISKFCEDTFLKKVVNTDLARENILFGVKMHWTEQKKGYRDGVILVPIHPSDFTCPIVKLTDGMILNGEFSPRVNGEEPRKKFYVPNVNGSPAKFVDVVLYSRAVLEETHENSIDVDWEVITVLPKLDEDQPMDPQTLMYNHFKLNGGTSTNMNDSEFVKELEKSFVYWKDKAMI